jgi:hypothetical protein
MFLPRILAESLGIIRVGGGRGLWLFAEIDTIVFDLVLLYAIVYCTRSLLRGRARMTATFASLRRRAGVMTAGPMLYTVNNFGTLFRLRLMVYYLAAILCRYIAKPELMLFNSFAFPDLSPALHDRVLGDPRTGTAVGDVPGQPRVLCVGGTGASSFSCSSPRWSTIHSASCWRTNRTEPRAIVDRAQRRRQPGPARVFQSTSTSSPTPPRS